MRILINGILVLFSISLILIYILTNQKKIITQDIKTLKTAYSLFYQEEKTFAIKLYINDENSIYKHYKQFDSIAIVDYNEDKVLQLTLEEVKITQKVEHNKDLYYEYQLISFIPNLQEDFYIENCYLKVCYMDKIDKLYLGSLNIFYSENINPLSYQELFGITNTYENQEMLVGIVIDIYNTYTTDIIIKEFRVNNVGIAVNHNEIKEVESSFADYKMEMSKIIQDYQLIHSYKNTKSNLIISSESSKKIILPLHYQKMILANFLPIKIIYEINGIEYQYVIDNYLFYESILSLNNNPFLC